MRSNATLVPIIIIGIIGLVVGFISASPFPLQEIIIETEVIKEIDVEVEVVTTEEGISPVSYVAIGLGVVLVVVSGVLYTRSKGD